MCLIVFDWRPDVSSGALLTVAANRDEFFRRETLPLAWWSDAPGVLAGRDLAGGGTWLGLARDGRFAALTNYRAPHDMRADAPTRGALVSDFLSGARRAPLDYLADVAERGAAYNGFNLIVADLARRELAWYCNRSSARPRLLAPGTHGISNAILDTPWPKLAKKRAELAAAVAGARIPALADLIALMADPRVAPDEALPSTGIPLERERALSAAFIELPDYGTRSTTVLRASVDGQAPTIGIDMIERSDDDGSHRIARPGTFERAFSFRAR
jgi:uncharacterized protein with NRDE domain